MGYAFVVPRLAQGSAPPAGPLPEHFHTLVLTAVEYQPKACTFSNVKQVIHVELNDGLASTTNVEKRIAILAAKDVAKRYVRGEKVLITCWKGRNRSGLVTALTLVELGVSGQRAIELVRNARGWMALRRDEFVELVQIHAASRGIDRQVQLC